MKRYFDSVSPPDPVLAISSLALIGLGAVMVGSASVGIATEEFGQPFHYFWQHLGALAIGLIGATIAARIPIDWLNRFASVALAAAIVLLALVLIPGIGDQINGARRWMQLGPVSLQASEPARLLLLVYVASYAVRQHEALGTSFGGFLRPMVIIVLASLLLLSEPDFGATVVLTATSFGILFLAGARLRDLFVTGLVAVGAFVGLVFSADYRLQRFLSYLDPWAEPLGTGYQVTNSQMAIGSGSWFGVGLGEGVQKLHYLPEPHTDFIFAVLAVELGLMGSTLVIVLFSLIVYRAFVVGLRAQKAGLPFHGLLSMGIGLMLGLEAAISIGVNTGDLPPKGIALPLISYGRTSAVATLFALGLLFRVSREVERARENLPRSRAS